MKQTDKIIKAVEKYFDAVININKDNVRIENDQRFLKALKLGVIATIQSAEERE